MLITEYGARLSHSIHGATESYSRRATNLAGAKVRSVNAKAQEVNLLIRWRRLWDVHSPN